MKNQKITISDIAETLGISPVSISRALSGQPGVSKELKQKITAKAEEMGYSKNKKTLTANILVLHQKPYMLDNSNFSLMLQSVEKSLKNAKLDFQMEFIDETSQDKGVLPYKLTKGDHFDGVIFIGKFDPQYCNGIKEHVHNFVFFTGYSPAFDSDIVRFNFNHAGYKQCEYLINKGHTQIAFFGNQNLFRNQERFLGIQAALHTYQISISQTFFLDTNENYSQRLIELISNKKMPTAVICDYDFTAVELIQTLYTHQIKVPDDVSIIGCGNSEISRLCIPSLTTLALNINYASEVLIKTILQRINNPGNPAQTTSILCDMVERDSVKSR